MNNFGLKSTELNKNLNILKSIFDHSKEEKEKLRKLRKTYKHYDFH